MRLKWIHIIWLLVLPVVLAASASLQAVQVTAEVSQQDIYLGEPFQYTVVVEDCGSEPTVDTSALQSWSPQYLGSQPYSQQSVTIINGRRRESVTKRYFVKYQLTPPKTGRFNLPPIPVTVEGRNYTTNVVPVTIKIPQTTDKIDLEVTFSEQNVFVGQPVTVTVKWYIAANVGDFHFDIPVFRDDRFVVAQETLEPPITGEQVKIDLDSGSVIAAQANTTHNGQRYLLVAFRKIIIPRQAGIFNFTAPAVSCNLEVQRSRSSRRDDFFDNPFFGRREYERFLATAEAMTLQVNPLPSQGRPAEFSGLVGRYQIQADASPTTVNVGDPITLTVTVQGALLDQVNLPDLATLPGFAQNFKIPSEQSSPKIDQGQKTFTQTIRAANEQITEIPAIPLSYFDVDDMRYITAQSDPIPLKVEPTRIVTAADAVGQTFTPIGRTVEAVQQGIAANYEGPELLKNQKLTVAALSNQWPFRIVLCVPAAVFIFSALFYTLTRTNPQRQRARQKALACRHALTVLKQLTSANKPDNANFYQNLAEALRQYVGDYYDKPPLSLTTRDCESLLRTNHRHEKAIQQFCEILDLCDQGRFAGLRDSRQINLNDIKTLLKNLDKSAKK